MPVAAAIAGAAVIGGGASIISANKAAKASTNAANKSNALQTDIYNQNKATLSPYVGAGNSATEQLRRLLGLGDSNTGTAASPYTAQQQQAGAIQAFKDSSQYQFQLNEGLKAQQTAYGNKGLLDSGAAQKAALTYGQSVALGALGQYQDRLSTLSGTGLQAASAQAGVGQDYAGAVGANNTNAANTQANAALSNAANINGILQSGLSAYGYSQGMKSSYGSGVLGGGINNVPAALGRTPPIYGGY